MKLAKPTAPCNFKEMRVLFVSSSLPNSLALENQQIPLPIENAPSPTFYTKKVVSKTLSSSSQIKSPILSTKPVLTSSLDEFSERISLSPQKRRSRKNSTTSLRSSISLINKPEELEDIKNLRIWKFTEMSGHAALSAASSLNLNDKEKLFIGWPGPIQNEQGKEIDYASLASETIEQIENLYKSEVDSIPVFLDTSITDGHANYCNSTLWPILHYLVWDNPVQCKKILQDWKDYVRFNEAFAEKILEVYKAGDCIWILDHQLLLLPEILRQKLRNAPIGLYLRNTFPSSELFRCLPQAEELMKGMLGANLIGFQAYAYARHFTSCCTRILGLEASLQRIDYEGAPVELAVIPTGIAVKETIEILQNNFDVKEKYERFTELYRGLSVLVGIDRINQSKGIIQKLKAYERFLKDHPEWVGKVILVQVILPEQEIEIISNLPTTPADLSLITDLASQINSRFGSIEYAPVSIYHQDIELSEYYALLQVADCFISTKERDSISLVPLDFVLCQEIGGKRSPIILSEFTALSVSMSTSLLINPWDHAAVVKAINSALIMSLDEKDSRHQVSTLCFELDVFSSFLGLA